MLQPGCGESLLAEAFTLLEREVVLEERDELFEEQAGELLAHGDASPQCRLGLERRAQLGQADQEDLDPAGSLSLRRCGALTAAGCRC